MPCGEVVLDKKERAWREKNSLGYGAFEMPVKDGRCPVKYCFHWPGPEQWKTRSFSTISMWVVVVWSV